jgi:hypothetical protein
MLSEKAGKIASQKELIKIQMLFLTLSAENFLKIIERKK